MTVYVDNGKHPYRGMKMCHMPPTRSTSCTAWQLESACGGHGSRLVTPRTTTSARRSAPRP